MEGHYEVILHFNNEKEAKKFLRKIQKGKNAVVKSTYIGGSFLGGLKNFGRQVAKKIAPVAKQIAPIVAPIVKKGVQQAITNYTGNPALGMVAGDMSGQAMGQGLFGDIANVAKNVAKKEAKKLVNKGAKLSQQKGVDLLNSGVAMATNKLQNQISGTGVKRLKLPKHLELYNQHHGGSFKTLGGSFQPL
jgi:hypothetical protein